MTQIGERGVRPAPLASSGAHSSGQRTMVGCPGTCAAAGPLLPGSSYLASLHPQVPGTSPPVTALSLQSPTGWLWRVERTGLLPLPRVSQTLSKCATATGKLALTLQTLLCQMMPLSPPARCSPCPWVLWGGNAGAVRAAATSSLVRHQQTPPNYLQRKQEAS